jgi:hypothetical protein
MKRRVRHSRWKCVGRTGPWLLAIHDIFSWRPRVSLYVGRGWSVWWLWFEVARVR